MTVIPAGAVRRLFLVLLAIVAVATSVSPLRAQQPAAPTGTIEGTVSTQNGSVKLPGVVISIRTAKGVENLTAVELSRIAGEW